MRYLNILFSILHPSVRYSWTSCTYEAFAQLLLRSHKLCGAGCIVSRTLRVRNVSSPSPQSSPSGKRAARKLANGLHCGMHRGVLPILMISPLFFAHRFPPPPPRPSPNSPSHLGSEPRTALFPPLRHHEVHRRHLCFDSRVCRRGAVEDPGPRDDQLRWHRLRRPGHYLGDRGRGRQMYGMRAQARVVMHRTSVA